MSPRAERAARPRRRWWPGAGQGAALLGLVMFWGGAVLAAETYYRQDLQYFKPPLAELRGPHTYMRLYSHRPVAYTRNPDRDHRFWDVGFGGHFAWWGVRAPGPAGRHPMDTKGVEVFWEPSAHALLDFGAHSNALINADYRIGLGVAGRSLPGSWAASRFSWRVKAFHESSHLGDEFVLDALKREGLLTARVSGVGTEATDTQTFQRHNVGYEALEIGVSVDAYRRDYWRLYWMGRRLNQGVYAAEPLQYLDPASNAPLRAGRWETQAGAEYLAALAPLPARWWNPNRWIALLNTAAEGSRLLRLLFPKLEEARYWVVAGDGYLRTRYTATRPRWAMARHLLTGLVWGDYFAADEGVSAFALLLSYYRGPHPHGQFRRETLEYWGAEFRVRL